MNQKQIGVIVIVLGILIGAFIYFAKAQEDFYIKELMKENDSCFLDDGTCLHADRNLMIYVFGWVISAALIILGIYLFVFDKTQEKLEERTVLVSEALKEAKSNEKNKREFEAFLAGFSEDERKVLIAIKEQDGIKQSTLRYRTDMSKTTLSLMLKSLEERKIVKRKPAGKTNNVFLIKKF